jgi:hypothetical protein
MKLARILSVMLIAMLAGAGIAAATGWDPSLCIGGLALASLVFHGPANIMAISLIDLARPTGDNVGGGGGISSDIILIHNDDINWNSFPARAADGVTISSNIPMQAGKYFHRFYMTQKTIKPNQKKVKGSNDDCGGYEISIAGFYPGIEKAIQAWIAAHGISFKGLVIVQNCASSKRYLIGEPCNLVIIDAIDTVWGEDVSKDKGSTVTFKSIQSVPMAFYEGAMLFDPSSASW